MLKIDVVKSQPGFRVALALDVLPGFTALYGPSGSGKTTVLNMISGLLDPSEGEIILNDKILFSRKRKINLPPQKRHLGYIFQESRLFPHLTVQRNLEFGYARLRPQERKFLLPDIVEVTGVGPFLGRYPEKLSGGEKQRVAIARALLASPEFLLMDEPFAALDLPTRYLLLKFIQEIHLELGVPILYVTHDVSTVLTFADRVIVLKNGESLGYDVPYAMLSALLAEPLVPYEDIPNILNVTIAQHDRQKQTTLAETGSMRLILPRLDKPVGENVVLNIPASEIILATQKPDGISASNILSGTILELHRLGERFLAEVDAGTRFYVEIVPATVRRLDLKAGQKVYLIMKASAFKKIGNSPN